MSAELRFKLIRNTTWALSLFALVAGLMIIREPQISRLGQVFAALMIDAGGAFFFALTVGWIIDRLRNAEGYSVLWLFSQEFRTAGVLAFYADRKGFAERALEEAFASHSSGEVLMVGASLRLFLEPGLHFYPKVQQMLEQKRKDSIVVRALSCSPETNHELPVRSFVEEFNQDGSFSREKDFDWERKITFLFSDYEGTFYNKHGLGAHSDERARVVHDLLGTRTGVKAIQSLAKAAGNHLYHKEFNSAPYCTVIIFPDRAFYTPNLLSTEVPVNMPMIVFHKSSDSYARLRSYANFLWWVSDDFKVGQNA